MSNASPQVIEYLTRQLGRNPISESGDIVRTRAKAFRLESKQTSPQRSGPTAEQRQKVRDQLEQVRQTCFTGPVDQLLSQIRQLPVGEFPELAALARRLTVVLESRGKLPALASDPRFDGDFFSVLKKILVSPSRDVAVLREQVLASFRHRQNRRRGQGMIRMLKTELPDLYALETDWLESLLRYSPRKHAVTSPTAKSVADEGSSGARWPAWLLIFLVAPLVRGCIRMADDSNSSSPSRSTYSAPKYTQPRVKAPRSVEGEARTYRPDRSSGIDPFRSAPQNGGSRPSDEFEQEMQRARARIEEMQERHRALLDQHTPRDFARPPNTPTPGFPRGNSSGRGPSGPIQPSFAPSVPGR